MSAAIGAYGHVPDMSCLVRYVRGVRRSEADDVQVQVVPSGTG
jgi:hypothetical protein